MGEPTRGVGIRAMPQDEINAKKLKEFESWAKKAIKDFEDWKGRFEKCEFKSIDVLADTNDEQNDRLDALEEKTKELDDVSWDKDAMYEWAKTEHSNLGEAIRNLLKPLESKIDAQAKYVEQLKGIIFMNDKEYIEKLNKYSKEMAEKKAEYYDMKTITHFISDIYGFISNHQFKENDKSAYWSLDVSDLEQFLIDTENRMKRYNKEQK